MASSALLQSSAAGYLALLEDTEDQLREHALTNLLSLVDKFWFEISEQITKIEELHEDKNFKGRDRAALLAAKVFYHLNAFPDALHYALQAGELFDLSQKTEFVETLITKCIDRYITERQAIHDSKRRGSSAAVAAVDPLLEAVVERMFERCFQDGEYRHAIGVALEARRLDKIEQAIRQSGDMASLLNYTFRVVMELVSIDFRATVLRSLVKLYHECPVPDYVNMSRCLIFLDDPQELAKILESLIRSSNGDDTLLAFQIAFELCDNSTQHFLENVRKLLPPVQTQTASPSAEAVVPKSEEATDKTPLLSAGASDAMDLDQSGSADGTPFEKALKTLHRILTGEPTIDYYLQFLYRNNHTDLGVLKALKSAFEPRVSILHTATIVTNALMHAGTTRDTFLRENLEWLGKAINWAKFSTTAGLGVIHRGHLNEAMKVLEPYLPKPGNPASPYTEGGSLYALGIIHANHGTGSGHTATQYLLQQLRDNLANETVVHGACLGLGVTAMASGNTAILDELMNILYSQDNAVAGEAAGYGIGLVMLGSAHEKALELLNHARDTQHEKIIRGIAIGLAHMYYGREEEADAMIEQLSGDKDPILRYGGMFMIGLAFAGTNNNQAIKKLLHVAVSDVNDDVRRAAVMMLGLVNFRQPDQVPKLVSLLSESYNPAVRYGACLAIGIACAGTGMKEAYDMLMPMAKNDAVDFVRQGALIALAMVHIQTNSTHSAEIRKLFRERVEDKHETVMCKMGSILATGIIDAGGRNVTLSLKSRAGHRNMQAVVGIAMFLQYWYWYPLTHFISLAFTPTAVIGLNKDLRMPKMQFRSNAAPSSFAYPPEVKPPEENKNKKVEKIELSAAKRAKGRATAVAAKSGDAMDVDTPAAAPTTTKTDKMEVDSTTESKGDDKDKEATTAAKKEPEPTFEVLENPARVTRAQLKFISFDVDPRYRPVTEGVMGVVMLKDLKPGEEEEIITEGVPALGSTATEDGNEPSPPEPFEFEG